MIKLWSNNEIIKIENIDYLDKDASKRFYKVFSNWLSDVDTNSYVNINEATDILNDMESNLIKDSLKIYNRDYDNTREYNGSDAYECIKDIGLKLVKEYGYPHQIVTKQTLLSLGDKISSKYKNFHINEEFLDYEKLLEDLHSHTVSSLIKKSNDIWDIYSILLLTKRYSITEEYINPSIIDDWLEKNDYKVDSFKSEIFLKILGEIINRPQDFLSGENIIKYFNNNYEIGRAIKDAINYPVTLDGYSKKNTKQTIIDVYKKLEEIYLKEFNNRNDISDKELFEFIESVPKKILDSGFDKELIGKIRFTNLKNILSKKFSNFNLNQDNFELYLLVKNKLKDKDITKIIEGTKDSKQLYEVIYACCNYSLLDEKIDFNIILNKFNSITDLSLFIKLIEKYKLNYKNFDCKCIDEYLSKYYDDKKYTNEIINLIEVLSNFMDIDYFINKYNLDSMERDYAKGTLKPFNTYVDSNIINEEDSLKVVNRRRSTKKDKVYSLIAGSGIISFIKVVINKQNPVPIVKEFQQLSVASGLSESIGDFSEYLKSIVNTFNEYKNNYLESVEEKGKVM